MKEKYELWESEEFFVEANPDLFGNFNEQIKKIVEAKCEETGCNFEMRFVENFETFDDAEKALKNRQSDWIGFFENRKSTYITLLDITKIEYGDDGEIENCESIINNAPSIVC